MIGILSFYVMLVVALAIALLRGGAPERYGGIVLVVMLLTQFSFLILLERQFSETDIASIAVDVVGLTGFGWIALNAKRIWPIWAASLQLLSLFAHVARFLNVQIDPWVYSILKSGPTAFAIAALMIGSMLHHARLSRLGVDPDWEDWQKMSEIRAVSHLWMKQNE